MSALDDLYIEIEKHAVMRGHASLLLKVREEHSRMLSDLMKYEVRHEVDIREKDRLREQNNRCREALSKALPVMVQDLEAFGDCDHSVGVCNCDLKDAINYARGALAA